MVRVVATLESTRRESFLISDVTAPLVSIRCIHAFITMYIRAAGAGAAGAAKAAPPFVSHASTKN